ncbi:MAG TPA: 50S ribosomal protein L18 [Candidatus Hydrogenedentes bacterium]|mgnify:CR=1 FL=1|nr:50S ribosomal protein L18 [Candidatus Hydrogenedentota bacterium]HRK34943.1 50S ribosomal protein L18 [Candidatus Hydrogenedentota bacterium]
MSGLPEKFKKLSRRKMGIRKKIVGTTERPRLTVRPTLKHIYAQLIDDSSGKTIVSASSVQLKITGGNVDAAKAVGKAIAESAKAKSVERVCFDRNGRLYHGRIKALADAAREGGLEF